MQRTFRPTLFASAALAAAFAFAAPPAFGAITSSSITSPSEGTVFTVDKDHPTNTTISGTSDGTTGDNVQIVCYFGNSGFAVVEQSLPVQAGGGFSTSVPNTDFYGINILQPCILRAVPDPGVGNDPPPEPPGLKTTFSGPTIMVEGFELDRLSSGPNAGVVNDYYLQDIQSQGGFDYVSAGDCGVYDSYLWDDVFTPSDSLFYCNDGVWAGNGNTNSSLPAGYTPATGSELKVDGGNAFLVGAIPFEFGTSSFRPQNVSGLPALNFSPVYDPTTHAVTITESDVAAKCAPDPIAYPPNATSCTSYVSAGIRLDRTIVQSHDGRLTVLHTKWSSTDGAPHHLQLELQNDQNSSASDIAYEFPWISPNFAVYNDGALPGAPNGPGRIYVKGSLAANDGDTTHPRGVIVFAGAPKAIRFITDQTGPSSTSSFLADYDFNVPAGGSVRTAFAYGDAFTQAEVTALGDAAEATFPRPSITLNPVAATSFAGKVNVSGKASDPEGLLSLTVNGVSTPVAADGSWNATLPLNAGHNTITATVTNLYGTTAQASAPVVYAKLGLVGRPRAKGHFVVFKTSCAADPSGSCPGNAVLASKERLRGKQLTGVTAKKRKLRSKTVRTGHKRFRVKGGQTQTIKVPLNKAALKLLRRFHKLPVRLNVTVAASGVRDRVGGSKVVFHQRKKKHRHG